MGDVLNEAERERVREETLLRAEVRREVEAAFSKKLGWFGRLNSPFMITVMGGIFITIAGQLFVRVSSVVERRQALDQATLEKKLAVLTSYATDVETAEAFEGAVLAKRRWLREHPNADDRDDFGLPRAKVEDQLVDIYKAYLPSKKMLAVLTEVRAFFVTAPVQQAADTFDNAWTAVEEAKTADEQKKKWPDAVKASQALAQAMSEEIRQASR